MENKLWYDKYAPQTLDECVLPGQTRKHFEKMVADKYIPNLILHGSAGIGKTTAARVLVQSIDAEYILIPSSIKNGIDVLRTEIQQFASTISLNGERKYVILDEADNLTSATQLATRGFIDEFTHNCGFIFTCNYRQRILAPISESRLEEVSFAFSESERMDVAKAMFNKLKQIFNEEQIKYTDNAVKQFVVEYLRKSSDLRYMLVQAQKASRLGEFQPNSVSVVFSQRVQGLVKALQAKDFDACRTWIGENSDIDPNTIFTEFYASAKHVVGNNNIAPLVAVLGKYQYYNAFVADREINLAACMVEIIQECF